MAEGDGPDERARVHWSVPPPPPGDSVPGSSLGEEFLYHLYRGSSLLQEDQFYEAKSELERALALQPREVEGQSLLGIVYFRLGHYPRAIQIYEELIRVRPEEVAPRVNLALCYLKTGQLSSARSVLDELVQHRPDHLRAWGYLGLVYQRLGDFEKASVAFERAGRHELASRLRAAHASEISSPPVSASDAAAAGVQEIAQRHVNEAVSVVPPPPESIAPGGGSVPPRSLSGARPAPGTRVSVPVSLERTVREAALIFPELPRVVIHHDGVVLARIDRAFQARSDCIRALLPDSGNPLTSRVLRRRGRSSIGDEPLGGMASPFATLQGEGRLVLGVPEPFSAFIATMEREPLYAREDRLIGFDSSVEHEWGRLGLPGGEIAGVVHLTGAGFVVLATRGPLHGIDISAGRPMEVRATRVIGWVGRLLASTSPPEADRLPLRDMLTLSGNGTVLIDGG